MAHDAAAAAVRYCSFVAGQRIFGATEAMCLFGRRRKRRSVVWLISPKSAADTGGRHGYGVIMPAMGASRSPAHAEGEHRQQQRADYSKRF